jgi:cell division protein FtsI/penicillin-binding protein 2
MVFWNQVSLKAKPAPTNIESQQLQSAVNRSTQPGAVVVIDVSTGNVLAGRGMEIAAHRLARPGSTLKPFVLMELLEAGKLDSTTRVVCRHTLTIGAKRMDCSHPAAISDPDAADAIAYSCNSFVSSVATRLTSAELAQLLRRAGLDSRSDLAREESTGRISQAGKVTDLQLQALGDWGVETTPLELLAAYRRLALRRRSGRLGRAESVFDGLEGSVSYGMAHAAYVKSLAIAGKTGTAASAISSQTHGFFVGFAPAEQPEIAVVVYVEHGNGLDAATLAQPIFEAFAKNRGRQ